MNRSTLVAIVAVIIIAIGVVVVATHKSNNTTNSSSTSTTNTPAASSTSSNSNQQTAGSGSVEIKNMAFTPSQISVKKGDTVTWTNNDSTTHTVIDDLSDVGGPSSGNIDPGSTYSFTFNKTGSFQYHCSLHPSMRGTIVVK